MVQDRSALPAGSSSDALSPQDRCFRVLAQGPDPAYWTRQPGTTASMSLKILLKWCCSLCSLRQCRYEKCLAVGLLPHLVNTANRKQRMVNQKTKVSISNVVFNINLFICICPYPGSGHPSSPEYYNASQTWTLHIIPLLSSWISQTRGSVWKWNHFWQLVKGTGWSLVWAWIFTGSSIRNR